MREQIKAALQASKADYTEIRLEKREGARVVYRGQDLETADMVIDHGGIVRSMVKGGGWGLATFNDLSDLSIACGRPMRAPAPSRPMSRLNWRRSPTLQIWKT